jgi:class 3 adenylate cyclase/tetratricopeptide (TPR) repeat protein
VSDRGASSTHEGDSPGGWDSIDALLDGAVAAINRGDRVAANALAGQVLAVDRGNSDAEDLLTAPTSGGEIRRLTIMFTDLVGSTALSTRAQPRAYGVVVTRYRDLVLGIVDRFEGYVASTKGDGLTALFGHPTTHEDDVRRAVLAGLDITRELAQLSRETKRDFGIELTARVGIHRGVVYLDTVQDDVYGLAANLAAGVSGLAPPGSVVISDAVAPLVANTFDLEERAPGAVKGVHELISHHLVLGERATLTSAPRSLLVGREDELAILHRSWAHAMAGPGSAQGVVLRAEAGIGKSRLAAAAVEHAEHSGAVVLELTGSSFHTDAGLHPVRTLIENRCGISRMTAPAERLRLLEAELTACGLDPTAVVPLLAPVLGIGGGAGYEPVAAEGRKLYHLIKQAVHDYLLACCGERPGLVLVEDAHWFDPSTLDVCGSLLELTERRLLVVVTGRQGSWLPASWPVTVIDLKPLTDHQTDMLIAALNPGLSEHDRAAVASRCDGVPFFVEQVLGGVTETGVPDALYEPLLARLRASANVVPVVEVAALIGRQLDHSLLCSAVDLSEDVVDAALRELEDASVLEPWGFDGWRFRHELLRELAAELAPPSVRRGLHARVADALIGEAGGEPDWPLVAGHYEQAERHGEATSAFQLASTDARRRGALGEARSYLTRALTQVSQQPSGRDRDRREMTVRLERGFLITAAEGPSRPAASVDFEQCLKLGGSDVRDDEVFATLLALAGYYFALGDLHRATSVFESLRPGLGEGREFFRPVLESSLGILAWLRGEFAAASEQISRAAAEFDEADRRVIDAVWFAPTDPMAMALGVLALNGLTRGDLNDAEAQLTRAAGRADELSFPQGPFSRAFAHFFEIWLRIECRQFERAAALASGLVDHAHQYGFEVWGLWGAAQQATVAALACIAGNEGDPNALSAHVEQLTAMVGAVRGAGLTIYIGLFDGALGRLLIAAGRLDEARAQLNAGLATAHQSGMAFYDAELLRLRAHTHVEAVARQADIDAALELARRQGATLVELRAAFDDFELRGEPARAALVDVAGRIPDGTWPELVDARLALDRPTTR